MHSWVQVGFLQAKMIVERSFFPREFHTASVFSAMAIPTQYLVEQHSSRKCRRAGLLPPLLPSPLPPLHGLLPRLACSLAHLPPCLPFSLPPLECVHRLLAASHASHPHWSLLHPSPSISPHSSSLVGAVFGLVGAVSVIHFGCAGEAASFRCKMEGAKAWVLSGMVLMRSAAMAPASGVNRSHLS